MRRHERESRAGDSHHKLSAGRDANARAGRSRTFHMAVRLVTLVILVTLFSVPSHIVFGSTQNPHVR